MTPTWSLITSLFIFAGEMDIRIANKYRLGRKIGGGSFGDLYLGTNLGLHFLFEFFSSKVNSSFPLQRLIFTLERRSRLSWNNRRRSIPNFMLNANFTKSCRVEVSYSYYCQHSWSAVCYRGRGSREIYWRALQFQIDGLIFQWVYQRWSIMEQKGSTLWWSWSS